MPGQLRREEGDPVRTGEEGHSLIVFGPLARTLKLYKGWETPPGLAEATLGSPIRSHPTPTIPIMALPLPDFLTSAVWQ